MPHKTNSIVYDSRETTSSKFNMFLETYIMSRKETGITNIICFFKNVFSFILFLTILTGQLFKKVPVCLEDFVCQKSVFR